MPSTTSAKSSVTKTYMNISTHKDHAIFRVTSEKSNGSDNVKIIVENHDCTLNVHRGSERSMSVSQ